MPEIRVKMNVNNKTLIIKVVECWLHLSDVIRVTIDICGSNQNTGPLHKQSEAGVRSNDCQETHDELRDDAFSKPISIQLLSKFATDSDLCDNYFRLHDGKHGHYAFMLQL